MTTSPRFPERRSRLKTILTKPRLQSIWNNHIRQALRQQNVTDLADYYDVHLDLGVRITNVTDRIFRGVYSPNTPVRVLLEKSKGLCRQLLVPDPIDALVLQTVVNSVLTQILDNQPNQNAYYQAQAHKINKSRKERIDEADYGPQSSWLSFQKAVFKFTKANDFLVVTDIANFFDYVDFKELRSIYGSFKDVDEDILDFIFYVLEHFNWRPDYMPDRQVGLPQMNFDAPRLLAHSFLFELDRYLTKAAVGSYVRYMDDMDIGVTSVGEGKSILRDIDLVLQTRGVRLNSGKSRIMSSAEAALHYFIKDNDMLTNVELAVERKKKRKNTNFDREINLVSRKFDRYLAIPGYFDTGNGEKILKRFLTFFIQHRVPQPLQVLESLLLKRPGLRDYVFRYITWLGYSPGRFDLIRNYLLGSECVDDASVFAGAKAIVDFGCPNTTQFKASVGFLAGELAKRGTVGFSSALWLLAKFGTQIALMKLVRDYYHVWSVDSWAGRQVGALFSRVYANPTLRAEFLALIRASQNAGAQSTYSLHRKIITGGIEPKVIYPYLDALSSSQPRQITFQKILLLKTFLRSPNSVVHGPLLAKRYKSAPLDAVEKYLLKGQI